MSSEKGILSSRSGDKKTLDDAGAVLSGTRQKGRLGRLLPFLGPALIASIAYVDPGIFAANIAGGAQFGYPLLWVIVASDLMAMYSHLHVPPDGVNQAEGLQAVASMLCEKFNTAAVLIHIIEEESAQEFHSDRQLNDEEEAQDRLHRLAGQWRKTGLSVTTEVLPGDPAQQIFASAAASQVGLIALATHGKSGMSAFWSSRVGPRVVSASKSSLRLIPVKK